MVLWISLVALVWASCIAVVVGACRAAALGDLVQVLPDAGDRAERFGRTGRRLLPRRRTHA